MYYFTSTIFAVPMWGFEVTNCKTTIHVTNTDDEVTWICYVTTTEREGDFITPFKAYVTALGRGCQAITQMAGGTKYPA